MVLILSSALVSDPVVMSPLTANEEPSQVKSDSASNVLAVPEPVMSLLFALLFIVVALAAP